MSGLKRVREEGTGRVRTLCHRVRLRAGRDPGEPASGEAEHDTSGFRG